MDFLSDIWREWNDQWGASVATILALIAILMRVGKGNQATGNYCLALESLDTCLKAMQIYDYAIQVTDSQEANSTRIAESHNKDRNTRL